MRMLSWLVQLARRMRSSPSAPDSNESPRDPYSYVRHPLVSRPGGRNAAVALEEPEEEQTLRLVGRGC
jgi:hypothetical protein